MPLNSLITFQIQPTFFWGGGWAFIIILFTIFYYLSTKLIAKALYLLQTSPNGHHIRLLSPLFFLSLSLTTPPSEHVFFFFFFLLNFNPTSSSSNTSSSSSNAYYLAGPLNLDSSLISNALSLPRLLISFGNSTRFFSFLFFPIFSLSPCETSLFIPVK
jgi:hypothetical protein